ncbi:MAG: hypothetical protein QM692_08160 [Thermomicrobiales bacterium]
MQQDRELGPGCNAIGLGMPSANQPLQPSQAWLDDHSACVGDRLLAVGMCYGVTDDVSQVEICTVTSMESDSSMSLGCRDISLQTEVGPFGPHPELTRSIAEQMISYSGDRQLQAIGDMVASCTDEPLLAPRTMVIAAFDGLPVTTEPVVLQVNVEQGKFIAFVSDEPTLNINDAP